MKSRIEQPESDVRERPSLPLRIGVSSRALFDLEEEHEIFLSYGVESYVAAQRERETVTMGPGPAYPLIKRLLALNLDEPLVDVVVISRNAPDFSLRLFNSLEDHGLPIMRGSFTSGRDVASFAEGWQVDLFLSRHGKDVKDTLRTGTAAARIAERSSGATADEADEIRLAFDGDAVLFSPEADCVFLEGGLAAFVEYERRQARVPLEPGPLGHTLLPKLAMLRHKTAGLDGRSPIRIALVTARSAPTHERVLNTFRAWGIEVDEAHFVGSHVKGKILRATRAHIFFDDQQGHIEGAKRFVPSALVPREDDAEQFIVSA